ncbi:hypothetical protein FH972_017074 [Carpinus fangiana]|uniref:Uncharacterized protein n=1 Tax=Carpinus fangiana TaxID=176857 RepID=A0A5N6RHV8_9ROSI|nr:hypothetical protein FH972_017074 [Carpinus fangiana]
MNEIPLVALDTVAIFSINCKSNSKQYQVEPISNLPATLGRHPSENQNQGLNPKIVGVAAEFRAAGKKSRRKNPIEQQELRNSLDLPISDRTCPSPKIGVCGARRACRRRSCPLQWGLRNLRRINDSDLLVVSDQEASKSGKDRSLQATIQLCDSA